MTNGCRPSTTNLRLQAGRKRVLDLPIRRQPVRFDPLLDLPNQGGSGGHISPGLAIAERFAVSAPDQKVIFACSNRSIDVHMLKDAGAEFMQLACVPFSRRPLGLARFVINHVRARWQLRMTQWSAKVFYALLSSKAGHKHPMAGGWAGPMAAGWAGPMAGLG